MLNCFAPVTEEAVISIEPIFENQLETWLSKQDERVKNWVKSVGFRAKSASYCLLSDAEGRLEKVLVGMKDAQDSSVYAQLAINLPKGVYKLAAKDLTADEQYKAFLAWGMASYQFTAYKKAPPFETKLQLPVQGIDQRFPVNSRDGGLSGGRSAILPPDSKQNYVLRSDYYQEGVHGDFRRELLGRDLNYLEALLRATYLVRDLINTPPQDMMPVNLAAVMVDLADEFGGKVTQIIGDDLLSAKYPLIHAVGRASKHSPRLIDMRWGEVNHPKITLIGKGVCFDSGGLDLKNASNMAQMKKDMAGAAHVIGLARIIMALRLPVCLRVLIPAVENAVSGDAYHPGDILISRQGISVEITNTDAEGRLVLADALAEAVTEMPELLLDFATLTGAARVALGTEIAALFTPDDDLAAGLLAAGVKENDPIWRLPLYKPYRKLIDSKIADITNSAASPYGGAITAALFLKEFVPDQISWAHFDMMAWNNSSKPGLPEGGEANTLRAVVRYISDKYTQS